MTRFIRTVDALCLLSLFAGACGSRSRPAAWSYDERVGLVVATADRACLTAKTDAIAPETSASVVDAASQRQYRAVVLARMDACTDEGARASGERGYTIRFDNPKPPTPLVAIAIVGAAPPFRASGGSLVADLDGDRRDEFFRSCTSGEGVHLTIWSDAPIGGVRRWHRYHPLGYDVSPTCTPRETDP